MNKIRPPPAAELGGWVATTSRSGECGETLGVLSFKLEMKLMGKKHAKKNIQNNMNTPHLLTIKKCISFRFFWTCFLKNSLNG